MATGDAFESDSLGQDRVGRGLRKSCLSYTEVLAQSVSVIAPSIHNVERRFAQIAEHPVAATKEPSRL
jgi:hypothetical protein